MAIQDAMKFIRESQGNKELRSAVNKFTPNEIFEQLSQIGYKFTMDEFEESVNMLHVKCQFQEEASQLMETAMWFRMTVS